MPVDVPETRFSRVGDDRIAYQVFGEGPVDLLWIIGMFETLDGRWDWPPYAHFLRRVGSFSRVITFDRRGSGASDRVSRAGLPVWEDWTDDARAVLDAAGAQRAAVYGSTDAGAVGLWFAATEPERTQALVLYCASARVAAADGYPGGLSEELAADSYAYITERWGTEALAEFASRTAAQDAAGSRRTSVPTRCATRSSLPRSMLVCRCVTCKKQRVTPIRGPPCVTTGDANP